MGPLIPSCPSLACDGAASGQLDQGLSGLMFQAVERQAPVAGLDVIRDPPESNSLVHDIGIDFQAGGDHGLNDSVKDGKKDLDGRGEGNGSDITAPTSSIPYRDIYIDGNSSSDDAHSSDSSYVSGEYYDSDDEDERASSSTTSSAISSVSSLQSPSSSFYSSSEESILTTASSRCHHPVDIRNNQTGVRNDAEGAAAVVLIGCRMCLTYYMVSKPADACPRCGDQGNHIVRFGG